MCVLLMAAVPFTALIAMHQTANSRRLGKKMVNRCYTNNYCSAHTARSVSCAVLVSNPVPGGYPHKHVAN